MYENIEITKKKYEWLNKNAKGYGDRFHGEGFIPFIKTLKGNSIIDIGTGRGGICEEYSKFFETVYGLDLALADQFLILSLALITSIGVAGIPSASFVAIIVILSAVGLPFEAVGIILGVDRILDMLRTSVNVLGDSCCVRVVTH